MEEHLSLKRVLADLLGLGVEDVKLGPKLHVLNEQAEHHHKEEEEGLSPEVRKLLGEEQLEELGTERKTRMDAFIRTPVRNQVPEQTSDSAQLG